MSDARISGPVTWDDLLRKGYLPEVLPPTFMTDAFADFVRTRGETRFLSKPRKAAQTRAVDYHSTKRGNSRRTFAFPHPESFHDIALFLADNWGKIEAHYALSKYSKSVPTRDGSGERAVRITPHQQLAVIVYKEMSPFRFIVKTDVSRFYPSIYTHSIPWGIHGKAASKADRSSASTTVPFNRLDELLRSAQDGQTVGLPVGPDSSRIIAEIVAVAVDRAFEARSKDKHFALVRHVDDVWIGATSLSEAEAYLYSYRECLREFELDINELKTSIFESSKVLEPMWPLSLKRLIREDFQRLNKEDQHTPLRSRTYLAPILGHFRRFFDAGAYKLPAYHRLRCAHRLVELQAPRHH